MLILLMLVGLRARVCMHPYDGAAVATDCKQTNKQFLMPSPNSPLEPDIIIIIYSVCSYNSLVKQSK
jgi:hypothetical protein